MPEADTTHFLRDFYKVLGVPHHVSSSDLRKAYRKRLLETHPDKSVVGPKKDSKEFRDVQEAWENLRSVTIRADYDARWRAASVQTSHRPGMQSSAYPRKAKYRQPDSDTHADTPRPYPQDSESQRSKGPERPDSPSPATQSDSGPASEEDSGSKPAPAPPRPSEQPSRPERIERPAQVSSERPFPHFNFHASHNSKKRLPENRRPHPAYVRGGALWSAEYIICNPHDLGEYYDMNDPNNPRHYCDGRYWAFEKNDHSR